MDFCIRSASLYAVPIWCPMSLENDQILRSAVVSFGFLKANSHAAAGLGTTQCDAYLVGGLNHGKV